jgi:hypothetical protein
MRLTTCRKKIENSVSYLLENEVIRVMEEGVNYNLLVLLNMIDNVELFVDLLYSTNEDSTRIINKIGGEVLHKHLYIFEKKYPENLSLRNIIEFKLNGGDLDSQYFNKLKTEFENIQESCIKKKFGHLAGSIFDAHEFMITACQWYIFDTESLGLIIEDLKKAVKVFAHQDVEKIKYQYREIQYKKDEPIIKINSLNATSSWIWGSYCSDEDFDERWNQIEKHLISERINELNSFIKSLLLLELAY